MCFGAVPVSCPRRIAGSTRIRKVDRDEQLPFTEQWGLGTDCEEIKRRADARFYEHGLVFQEKASGVQSRPKIAASPDVGNITWFQGCAIGPEKANAGKINGMWIAKHPTIKFAAACSSVHRTLDATDVDGAGRWNVRGSEPRRQRGRMPRPVRHRVAAEGLQTGGVRVETKLAVAKRHLTARIIPSEVVTCDKGLAVNPTTAGRHGDREKQQRQSGHKPGWEGRDLRSRQKPNVTQRGESGLPEDLSLRYRCPPQG